MGNNAPILDGYIDLIAGVLMTFAIRAAFWQSKLQKCVAYLPQMLNTLLLGEGCKEAIWMKIFFEEFGIE